MAIRLDKESLETLIKVAAGHYAEGDLAAAQRVLAGVVETELDDARPHKLLASSYFLQEQHAQAIHHYRRAAELDPADPYVVVALAELYLITLQLSASVQALARLRELDPKGEHPASARAKMLVEKYLDKLR